MLSELEQIKFQLRWTRDLVYLILGRMMIEGGMAILGYAILGYAMVDILFLGIDAGKRFADALKPHIKEEN